MSEHCRVVITGIGPVTSAGIGKEQFQRTIWNGRSLAQRVPAEWPQHLRTQWYVPMPVFDLAEHGASVLHDSALQTGDRLAILAAKLALEDAQFPVRGGSDRLEVDGLSEAGVLLGVSLGTMQAAFESYLAHRLGSEVLASAFAERKPLFNRMVVPKTMTNSPAAWVSIAFRLHGPAATINASCASGTYAVGEAFRRIKHGYDRVILTGGLENLQDPSGFMLRGFDALGVLTQSLNGQPGPFGKGRSGFLFAEGGACVLVLEELQHALDRGARIYAELLDYKANADAKSIMQIDPDGTQIRILLGRLAASRRIDYINAHGTGTSANDAIESEAIKHVFGPREPGTTHEAKPYVNSTKGIVGHTLGASGAIEAAVTALSVSGDTVHPNAVTEPLPGLNLPSTQVSASINHAITVSYGFGGHNAGLLLKKYG